MGTLCHYCDEMATTVVACETMIGYDARYHELWAGTARLVCCDACHAEMVDDHDVRILDEGPMRDLCGATG